MINWDDEPAPANKLPAVQSAINWDDHETLGMRIIDYSEFTPELAASGVAVLNMPNEAYHAFGGISKTGLDLIDRSPAHYACRGPFKQTRPMVVGSAIHCAVLEPDLFFKQYVLLGDSIDRKSPIYKKAVAEHGDGNVLVASEVRQVIGMYEGIQADKKAMKRINQPGWCEISLFATDPETGVLVKCRFDKLTESGLGIDLKSTKDSSYSEFQKTIANYRYHVQEAWYRYVFRLVSGQNLSGYLFLAVESEMPHCCKIWELDTESQLQGDREAMKNLETYAECVRSGKWPAPDSELELITLPAWAIDEDFQDGVDL